jgi:hypothetical protein
MLKDEEVKKGDKTTEIITMEMDTSPWQHHHSLKSLIPQDCSL